MELTIDTHNDGIPHITGPLWEESTSHQWIPLTKTSNA